MITLLEIDIGFALSCADYWITVICSQSESSFFLAMQIHTKDGW